MSRDRLTTFRANDSDLVGLATVAAHLQANGVPFPSKSDAIRHSISYAATALALLARNAPAKTAE